MGMMLFLAQWYYNRAQLQHEATESGWIFMQAVSYILANPNTFLLCWVHSSFKSQFNSAAVDVAETAQYLDADLALEAEVPRRGQCCE